MCPDNRSLPRTQPGAVPYLRLIGLVLSFALSWTKEIRGLSENDKNRRESPVSLFDCSYLLLRTVLNQRKQEEDVKIITAEGKKSHISAGMSTFSSNLCPFARSCSRRKNCFLEKLRKKIHTYISMTLLFSCSRFTSPSSEDGNKKVPFVCLFVAVLTTRKKDKTQRQKKREKKFDISILFVQLPPVRTILHWDVTSTGGGVRLWDADSDCRKG